MKITGPFDYLEFWYTPKFCIIPYTSYKYRRLSNRYPNFKIDLKVIVFFNKSLRQAQFFS